MKSLKQPKILQSIFTKHQFIQKDEKKVRELLLRVSKVTSDDSALEFLGYSCRNKNTHFQNYRPIDKIEFFSNFQLYNKLMLPLIKQLKAAQEQENIEQIIQIESKIGELLEYYVMLLITGKHRWDDKIVEEVVNASAEYLSELSSLTANPKILFQIYKAIPINDYDLDSRNICLGHFSYFSKDRQQLKDDLKNILVDILKSENELRKNKKQSSNIWNIFKIGEDEKEKGQADILDIKSKCKEIEDLLEDTNLNEHSERQLLVQIQKNILNIQGSDDNKNNSYLKDREGLIKCILNYIKMDQKQQQFYKESPFYPLLNCVSHIALTYSDEKYKYQQDHTTLRLLKDQDKDPRELFEEIHTFMQKYKDTEDIQYLFQFLACLEHSKVFGGEKQSAIYKNSSLFMVLERFISDILEDLHLHLSEGRDISLKATAMVLASTENIKDFIEVALDVTDALKYIMKTSLISSVLENEETEDPLDDSRKAIVELLNRLYSQHERILVSFGNSIWFYDSSFLEVYQLMINTVIPNSIALEIQTILSLKVIELLKEYFTQGNTPKYLNTNKEISDDEFYFAIKALLTIQEDSTSEEDFEEYLNDMFFNTEHFAKLCSDKHNKQDSEKIAIRCQLLNICFKFSGVDQMENYYSWKSEKRASELERSLDLFIKEGIRVDSYIENYLTCCTKADMTSNPNIADIYLRIAIKYSFLRIFDNQNEHFKDFILKKLTRQQYDSVIQEIEEQIAFQTEKMKNDRNLLKQLFVELELPTQCASDYQFLYGNVDYWLDRRNQSFISERKILLENFQKHSRDEEMKDHKIFLLGYKQLLKSADIMRNMSIQSSLILDTYFYSVLEGEKKIIQTLKLEKHIIGCFIDNFSDLNIDDHNNSTCHSQTDRKYSDSILLLHIERVAKYMVKTIDNEQKVLDQYFYPTTHGRDHLIAQQLVIYISYLSQVELNIENMGPQLFFILSRLLFSMIKYIEETKLPQKNKDNEKEQDANYIPLRPILEKIFKKNGKIFPQVINCMMKIPKLLPQQEGQRLLANIHLQVLIQKFGQLSDIMNESGAEIENECDKINKDILDKKDYQEFNDYLIKILYSTEKITFTLHQYQEFVDISDSNFYNGLLNHFYELNSLGRQAVLGIIRDKLVPAIKTATKFIKAKRQVFHDGQDKKLNQTQINEEDITQMDKKIEKISSNFEPFLTVIGLIELSCEFPASFWWKDEIAPIKSNQPSSSGSLILNGGIISRLENLTEIRNTLEGIFTEEESPYMFCLVLLEQPLFKANGLIWMADNILENIPQLLEHAFSKQSKIKYEKTIQQLSQLLLNIENQQESGQASINVKTLILSIIDSMTYIEFSKDIQGEGYQEMELLFNCFIIKSQQLFEQKITNEMNMKLLVLLLNSVDDQDNTKTESFKIQLSTYEIILESEYIQGFIAAAKTLQRQQSQDKLKDQQNHDTQNKLFNQALRLFKHLQLLESAESASKHKGLTIERDSYHFFPYSTQMMQIVIELCDMHNLSESQTLFEVLLEFNDCKEFKKTIFLFVCEFVYQNLGQKFFMDSLILKFSISKDMTQNKKILYQNNPFDDVKLVDGVRQVDSVDPKIVIQKMDDILWIPNYYVEYLKVNPADNQIIADESNLEGKVKEIKGQFEKEEGSGDQGNITETNNIVITQNKKHNIPQSIVEMFGKLYCFSTQTAFILISLFPQTILLLNKEQIKQIIKTALVLSQNEKGSELECNNQFSQETNRKICLSFLQILFFMVRDQRDLVDLYAQEIFEYSQNHGNFVDFDILRLILPAKREELTQFFNDYARKDLFADDLDQLRLRKELDDLNSVLVSQTASSAQNMQLQSFLTNKDLYGKYLEKMNGLLNDNRSRLDEIKLYRDITAEVKVPWPSAYFVKHNQFLEVSLTQNKYSLKLIASAEKISNSKTFGGVKEDQDKEKVMEIKQEKIEQDKEKDGKHEDVINGNDNNKVLGDVDKKILESKETHEDYQKKEKNDKKKEKDKKQEDQNDEEWEDNSQEEGDDDDDEDDGEGEDEDEGQWEEEEDEEDEDEEDNEDEEEEEKENKQSKISTKKTKENDEKTSPKVQEVVNQDSSSDYDHEREQAQEIISQQNPKEKTQPDEGTTENNNNKLPAVSVPEITQNKATTDLIIEPQQQQQEQQPSLITPSVQAITGDTSKENKPIQESEILSVSKIFTNIFNQVNKTINEISGNHNPAEGQGILEEQFFDFNGIRNQFSRREADFINNDDIGDRNRHELPLSWPHGDNDREGDYEDDEDSRSDNDSSDEDNEDEEEVKKEQKEWNEFLVLREKSSVFQYYKEKNKNIPQKNNSKEEQDIVQAIKNYFKKSKGNKVFTDDVIKQLDPKDELYGILSQKTANAKGKKSNLKNKEKKKIINLKVSEEAKEDDKEDKDRKDSEELKVEANNEEWEEDDGNNSNSSKDKKKKDKEEDDDEDFEDDDDDDDEDDDEHHDELDSQKSDERLLQISSSDEEEIAEDEEEENDPEIYDDEYQEQDNDYNSDEDDERSQSGNEDNLFQNFQFRNSETKNNTGDQITSNPPTKLSDEMIIDLYRQSLICYPESVVLCILRSFYNSQFDVKNVISDQYLLNPINGPQLMDGLFFLLLNPKVSVQDLRSDLEKNRNEKKFQEEQVFSAISSNYSYFYNNAMEFFKYLIKKESTTNHTILYMTLDAVHWEYLSQISVVKSLKAKVGFTQLSGLQCFLTMLGENFKDSLPNLQLHMSVVNKLLRKIQKIQLKLNWEGQEVEGEEQKEDSKKTTEQNRRTPILTDKDISNIFYFQYSDNQYLNEAQSLRSILVKSVDQQSGLALGLLRQYITSISTYLLKDAVELIDKGIHDIKKILKPKAGVPQQGLDKKFIKEAISHLYEVITLEDNNKVYDGFKNFASNTRELMRIFFSSVKKLSKDRKQEEIAKLSEVFDNKSFMKLVSAAIRQLQFFYVHFMGESAQQSVQDTKNLELEQIFNSYVPLLKLLYMLYPYFDLEEELLPKTPKIGRQDSLPQLAKITSKRASSVGSVTTSQYDINKPVSKIIEVALEKDKGEIGVEDLKKILEQGFCSIIKLFVGMNDQLFQKYVGVVSRDPQNLKSLDLETRILAIQAKALKKAEAIQDCRGDEISLKVDRKCVFEDAFRTIVRLKPHELLQKQFSVKFRKEEGIDQSGLTREWFSCLSKELFDQKKGLFRMASNKFVVLPSTTSALVPDHLTIFRFVGAITAKGVLEGYLLGIDFAKFFLKHITGTPLSITDLQDVDPELTQNLIWVLENNPDDLCATFTYEYEEMGEKKVKELVENGSEIYVQESNKKEYVEKLIDFVMIQQIKPQTQAFLEGFFSIFPKSELDVIDWMELGSKIAGAQEIDMKELRQNTEYTGGYSELSLCVQWFWEIMQELDEKMKHKFLFFLSGSYKIPSGKYKDLGFTIQKIFDVDKLPVAHTCFNQLDLPCYDDKETLQKKLLQAILEGNEGFGIA